MRPGERCGSPWVSSLAHDGEPCQCQGSHGCSSTRKSQNLAPAQSGRVFSAFVREAGELRTWSCPDRGLRPHPENRKSIAQACLCQVNHLTRSAAEPSYRRPGHTDNKALSISRLIRLPETQAASLQDDRHSLTNSLLLKIEQSPSRLAWPLVPQKGMLPTPSPLPQVVHLSVSILASPVLPSSFSVSAPLHLCFPLSLTCLLISLFV